MSLVEKLSREFELLTPQEKAEFLNRVKPSPDGEWIAIGNDVHFFFYDDEPLTEAEKKAILEAEEDVKAGRVKPWEQVKKELEL